MWDEWNANKDHLRDNNGPEGCLQLYVRKDIEILEDDVHEKGKLVRRGDRQVKDCDEDKMAKMRRRMLSDHDVLGEAGFAFDIVTSTVSKSDIYLLDVQGSWRVGSILIFTLGGIEFI